MLKRIGLLILTNLAIMTVLSVVMMVLESLGVFGMSEAAGRFGPALISAGVFGFGGAFISLWMSKWIAKRSTGATVIETPRNSTEAWLMQTVAQFAKEAGISMPQVAVYESPDLNAFATGPTRNNSLVAVSTGLLRSLDKKQVEAVIGHEVAHVANGDMVTLTLIQGVVNTFVIFLSRIIGSIVDNFLRSRDDERSGGGIGYYVAVMVSQLVLGILASIIVAWFSRRREFRADIGGASFAGKEAMIGALQRLGGAPESDLPKAMAAFGINGGGLMSLLSTHPPIEARIAALRSSHPSQR
jgi:heat shock protein HtpX